MLSIKLFGHLLSLFSLNCLGVPIYGALSTARNGKKALERSIILYRLHANAADYINFRYVISLTKLVQKILQIYTNKIQNGSIIKHRKIAKTLLTIFDKIF